MIFKKNVLYLYHTNKEILTIKKKLIMTSANLKTASNLKTSLLLTASDVKEVIYNSKFIDIVFTNIKDALIIKAMYAGSFSECEIYNIQEGKKGFLLNLIF